MDDNPGVLCLVGAKRVCRAGLSRQENNNPEGRHADYPATGG